MFLSPCEGHSRIALGNFALQDLLLYALVMRLYGHDFILLSSFWKRRIYWAYEKLCKQYPTRSVGSVILVEVLGAKPRYRRLTTIRTFSCPHGEKVK